MKSLGMDIVKFIESKIHLEEIVPSVFDDGSSSTSVFIGFSRGTGKVFCFEDAAHDDTIAATDRVKKICLKIRAKWKVENIAISLRLGIVPPKEASIIIAISSNHKNESLEALQFATDQIIKIGEPVPIYNKRICQSDTPEVGSGCDQQQWRASQECLVNPKSDQVLFRRNVVEDE